MSTSSEVPAVEPVPPAPVSLREAFLYWFKLGFISFGGPAGQISMMHTELVERRRWISEQRFLHALNYTMVLPGPEAQQLATYIGWLMHGTLGGVMAGVLFVLPSLAILIALTWVYLAYGDVPAVAGILYGIKPAVTAIVVFAAYRIGSRALRNGVLWAMSAAAFVAIFALHVPFPYIVLAAGIIGFLGGRVAPTKFRAGGGHGVSDKSFGPALIDDHTPVPDWARFTWRATVIHIAVGLAIWILLEGFLYLTWGWQGPLTQMGWFFTKAALVTFGGAYAVLPYVYQGGVEHYGWLTGTQMIDGLALGETTPDGRITLTHTPCIGMCDQAPAALVNDVVITKSALSRMIAIGVYLQANWGSFLGLYGTHLFQDVRGQGLGDAAQHRFGTGNLPNAFGDGLGHLVNVSIG